MTLAPLTSAADRQITTAPYGHLLTNTGAWSPDSQWIYYDVRSDPAGSVFDGQRIERVHVLTGDVEVVYRSTEDACCGVVTASPVGERIVFIHGPERPTPEWSYAAWHRRGVMVDLAERGNAKNLDARDLAPPFTPGALRGGTHVHVFSGDGQWVSFTYEDHVLATSENASAEANQRNVGVAAPWGPVKVPRTHPRNHDGAAFSVLVTTTVDRPAPGSDEIRRAFSDAWIGRDGYERADLTRQRRALAFLGEVVGMDGAAIPELFVVDVPDNPAVSADRPLQGTETTRPAPPAGTVQRRLTRTENRKYPGVNGPRHWPRSSPDGSRIAFLTRDDGDTVQLWTVSPNGGAPRQLTQGKLSIESAFSWNSLGTQLACVADGSVCVVDAADGSVVRLTPRAIGLSAPRPEACVFSPDDRHIAYMRTVASDAGELNQVFVADVATH